MILSDERSMYLQAVLAGQIGAEYLSSDELIQAHNALVDQVIEDCMIAQTERRDVMVFDFDWEYLNPN